MFDLGNYRDFPVHHWRRIRTTNMVERVNAEIKRRTKVVGAFPGRESLLRPVGSILMDTNEELQERYNTIDDRMPSIQIRVLQTHPRKEPRR